MCGVKENAAADGVDYISVVVSLVVNLVDKVHDKAYDEGCAKRNKD